MQVVCTAREVYVPWNRAIPSIEVSRHVVSGCVPDVYARVHWRTGYPRCTGLPGPGTPRTPRAGPYTPCTHVYSRVHRVCTRNPGSAWRTCDQGCAPVMCCAHHLSRWCTNHVGALDVNVLAVRASVPMESVIAVHRCSGSMVRHTARA